MRRFVRAYGEYRIPKMVEEPETTAANLPHMNRALALTVLLITALLVMLAAIRLALHA
jgi:hypothetical protein